MKGRGTLFWFIFWTTVICLTAHAAGPANTTTENKLKLRVIYFGQPQSPRANDFVDFLGKYFAQVKAGDLNTFNPKDTAAYDVVLLDYDELKIARNGIQMPNIPFTTQFPCPTMTIGATGALVCERLRLKTGYL